MGFLLFIIAFILYIPLSFINVIAVVIKFSVDRGFIRVINDYFRNTAVDIDKFGNRQFRTLFNMCLIRKNGIPFGSDDETISSILGKNERDNTLSDFGRGITKILNFLDKNHCIKSIKTTKDHEI